MTLKGKIYPSPVLLVWGIIKSGHCKTAGFRCAARDGTDQNLLLSTMNFDHGFISEVETAIASGSAERRADILRGVTDLFITGAHTFSDREIALFDEVITRLAVQIEVSARALLAVRLAPIRNAPPQTIRTLAFDDAIDVASPVLSHSERLDDADLIENVRHKSHGHMLAISRRSRLSEAVTDVLVERGDRQVLISTVGNRGAKFSNAGFSILVQRADDDPELTICVGGRSEIPPYLFRHLLARASHAVRVKLEAMHPEALLEVRQAVAEVSARIESETLAPSVRAAATPASPVAGGSAPLTDVDLQKLANAGSLREISSALAQMCELPMAFVEQAVMQKGSETLLVLARAAALSWPTVKAILMMRGDKRSFADNDVAQSLASYERLKSQTAQEILRFYRTREKGSLQSA